MNAETIQELTDACTLLQDKLGAGYVSVQIQANHHASDKEPTIKVQAYHTDIGFSKPMPTIAEAITDLCAGAAETLRKKALELINDAEKSHAEAQVKAGDLILRAEALEGQQPEAIPMPATAVDVAF